MKVVGKHLFFTLTLCLLLAGLGALNSHAAHGVSIDGKLKYPPDFTHFDYTSLAAQKGGNLVLHGLGSFDKMNPFTLKGNAPEGLGSLVFETLAVASLDEPFAKYGLIASDIELAADGFSVTFTIDARARFSDGSPVSVDDVKFSLELLKSDEAHPFYQSYFQDIARAEIIDRQTIRFYFSQKNRELHLIACELPILSRHFYASNSFTEPSMQPPIGSGPYLVKQVITGKSISYQRNPDYWALDHPTRQGMFNFETITYKYFKDQLVAVEAFKAGDLDFMAINIAKQWARDLNGPKFERQQIIKEYLEHKNNAGMQAFVFNLRKPVFQDRRVRQALGLAFDFEWTNSSLFFDQYSQNTSYFSNSNLAATGLPTGLELEYLLPFKDSLPAEVFTQPLTPVSTKAPNSLRQNLLQAKKLLEEAGWQPRNGILVNKADPSQRLAFEILLVSSSFERVMAPYVKNLEKLGVQVSYRTIDPALYARRIKNFEYDMVVTTFGQSQSPGNEQRDYWHSAAATRPGSRNLIGLREPVVDNLVDRIIYANTQEELQAACKALDRVLWYGYYVVPNWYLARHRVVYWDKFAKPAQLPLYYMPEDALMTWWMK